MQKFVLAVCALLFVASAKAQINNNPPPPPGGPPGGPGAPVPISGFEVLVAAGALLGGKKLLDRTRKKQ